MQALRPVSVHGDLGDIDLSWLTEEIRARGLETLTALFASSHICLATFDREGFVLAINAHTLAFGGQQPAVKYLGMNVLEHPILRRLGWSRLVERALAGESVEVTDSRWVTLFTGEERWVDVTVTPVTIDGVVVGGVACLIDTTVRHWALAREAALRAQMQELVLYMTRDLARPIAYLRDRTDDKVFGDAIAHLGTLLDDLREFLQVGSMQPRRQKLSLSAALLAAGVAPRAGAELYVYADPRLLRRALTNLASFASRSGGGLSATVQRSGQVAVSFAVGASQRLLEALLGASSLSAAEAAGADDSLAAARWMIELMGGALTASEDGHLLELQLPAADAGAPEHATG